MNKKRIRAHMRACEFYFHMEVSSGHQMVPEARNQEVAISATNRSNVGPVRLNLYVNSTCSGYDLFIIVCGVCCSGCCCTHISDCVLYLTFWFQNQISDAEGQILTIQLIIFCPACRIIPYTINHGQKPKHLALNLKKMTLTCGLACQNLKWVEY